MSQLNMLPSVESKNQIDMVLEYSEPNNRNPFSNIQKTVINFYHEHQYTDDQFKLPTNKNNPKIVVKRLSEIYAANTSLFMDLKTGSSLNRPTKKNICPSHPYYLAELNMLPFSHIKHLIDPPYINPKGYYYVVMYKDGDMVKEVVDDTVYYNEKLAKIQCHSFLEDHPWIHILLKAYAKKCQGYEKIQKCGGFDFLKTFSFPDWDSVNPSRHKTKHLIKKFSRVTDGFEEMVVKTKNDANVGYFGFTPDCASFFIRGHYQQYAHVFIKIYPMVNQRWNGLFSGEKVVPEQMPVLGQNQFLMPLGQFCNVFHLMFNTNIKYLEQRAVNMYNSPSLSDVSIQKRIEPEIHYQKYSINMDARDTKAIVIGLQVESLTKQNQEVQVGMSIYFPFIKNFDLVHHNHTQHPPGDVVVPWCKAIVGYHVENGNLDASYMENVKEKMLDYGENMFSFVSLNTVYEFIGAQYFKGYSNQFNHNFTLKPGKYYLRLKSEQKQAEYRCYLNLTSIQGSVKISDAKMGKQQQVILLKDCILSKARQQKMFVTYVNTEKKGSWIVCRNQFQTIGYGYIVAQTIKHNDNKIVISISPKKLKEAGYSIKGHHDQADYKITIDNEENAVIIIKKDKEWKSSSQRVWPPPGVEFSKIPKNSQHMH